MKKVFSDLMNQKLVGGEPAKPVQVILMDIKADYQPLATGKRKAVLPSNLSERERQETKDNLRIGGGPGRSLPTFLSLYRF